MIQTASLEITPEMLVLVAGIDEFKGAWRALGTLAPERLAALRRVATIESIGSSTRIETASPFDTPGRMAELVAWHAEAVRLGALHPLLAIGLFTVVFLEIHPSRTATAA